MDFTAVKARLTERRSAMLDAAITKLESGIAAGAVRNADYNDAKDTINRAVDEAFDKYQAETKDYSGRVMVMGAYNLPAAIKEAAKQEASGAAPLARRPFLEAMLPLHTLLQSAKPLVVKRQTGASAPKTPRQIEREAATMTCQCCGKRYLANTGTIAHHGYQRPGGGWQTASCSGAKFAPFEVSRDRLGVLITGLKNWKASAIESRAKVEAEQEPVRITFTDYTAKADAWGRRPAKSADVTRETFAAIRAENEASLRRYSWAHDFDSIKERDLQARAADIKNVTEEIEAQQARFDGWKQTHGWDDTKKEWRPV
ncbi:hypothetical protein [Bradyrhizobium sp. RT10b]|uniref:hypothetical protein n=1 Tax=Bradyrhizobium sp. RT10b TaxID=3156331 RepID=UPI00339275F9